MKIYPGIIKNISDNDPYNQSHNKKQVEILENDGQTAYIDFVGDRMLNLLDHFSIQDQVIIAAINKGNISLKTKKCFNNIIAKSIKKQS